MIIHGEVVRCQDKDHIVVKSLNDQEYVIPRMSAIRQKADGSVDFEVDFAEVLED